MTIRCVGVFAKYWEAGQVKTRLGAQIGMPQASRIYLGFLTTLLKRLTSVADRRDLVFSPTPRQADFLKLTQQVQAGTRSEWNLVAQSGNHLGERLQTYCRSVFQHEPTQLVVVGTDSPNLPLSYIHAAFESLQNHDVVIGPAEDGGYYLIGMNRLQPALFENIPWSTPETLGATLDVAKQESLTVRQLPIWYDVDESSTLDRLRDELAAQLQNESPLGDTDSDSFQYLHDLIQKCLSPPTDTQTSSL